MFSIPVRTNRFALASAVSALITVISFCIGFIPIPMTAWVCYPAAVLGALAAVITGIVALRQVRITGENGSTLAWVGIWTGVLSILAVLCFTTLTVFFIYFGVETVNSLIQQFTP